MKKPVHGIFLCLVLASVGCARQGPSFWGGTVEQQLTFDLACGSTPEGDCLAVLCGQAGECPVLTALSSPVVFDFVKTYSECKGCNTPDFEPGRGVGKCVEYLVSGTQEGWTVIFQVSENCSFRYANPGDSHIAVDVQSRTMNITNISPPVEYIEDPLYCRTDADCDCLSGSGVPFVGCRNYFYAPLNFSGYYPGSQCICQANKCVKQ